MRRYMTFAFPTYYPGGGVNDCTGTFDTLPEAQKHLKSIKQDNDTFQVFDTQTGKVVFNTQKKNAF